MMVITYTLVTVRGESGNEVQGIHCHHCGYVSFNVNDILQRYCNHCKRFHEPVHPIYES